MKRHCGVCHVRSGVEASLWSALDTALRLYTAVDEGGEELGVPEVSLHSSLNGNPMK